MKSRSLLPLKFRFPTMLLAPLLAAVLTTNALAENSRSTMKDPQHYTTTFTVDQTPAEVFAAINQVRAWWSGDIQGDTATLGSEFTYRVPNMHFSRQKIIELSPGKKVVWRVLEAELSFVQDKAEWKGTEIVFEITPRDGKTELRFTHVGLVPPFECYGACSNAWGLLVNGNLRKLILTGQPQPSPW